MSTKRAHQTLPSAEATQAALMAWLELIVSNTAEGATVRPVNGAGDNDQRFSLYVWCDQDLIGAALGEETSRGGEWQLTTYDIEVGDGFRQPGFVPRVTERECYVGDHEP